MMSTFRRARIGGVTRSAIAVALIAAVAGGVASPALARESSGGAPKIQISEKFQPLYVNFTKALDAAKASPAVQAAAAKFKAAQDSGDAAQVKVAGAALNATLADLKAKLDAMTAGAATPDDRYIAGQSAAISYGSLAADPATQQQGIAAMIASGKVAADALPQLYFFQGQFAFQQGDYAGAIAALTKATAAGYHQNNADVILAESLINNNQIPEGLAAWKSAIRNIETTTGQPAQEGYYGHALQIAYDKQLRDQTLDFGRMMISAYPSAHNWSSVITTVLGVSEAKTSGEELDLLRLLSRAGKITQVGLLSEYIRTADPRALPFEVKSVLDQAAANGVVATSDPRIAPGYRVASDRLAGERAALPGYKKDLTAASATALQLAGDGDSYLAFQMYPDAIAFYQAALAKPGVDADLINTRLGIAQTGAGDYAGAQATFAKVGGNRAPIAQLWAIYAKQKAAGK